MSYRTILVYLSDKRRAERLLEPVINLARDHNAHVIGLHAYPGLSGPPLPVPGGGQVIGMAVGAERKESDEIAGIFKRMLADQPFGSEWRAIEVRGQDLGNAVLEHARCADLVVAGQTDPDWDFARVLDFPERLAVESGRPVLVVPYVGRYPQIGRNAVVAWKATRECARAVFDAMPLLTRAQNVHIIEVAQDTEIGSDISVAAALGRHGIKPVVRKTYAPDLSAGDEILSRLADTGADLLVMGAYGHSRMREFVLGGVTRHIARHMTAPTLWSH